MGLAAVPLEAPSAPRHERHKPEETILYEIVANHLETFLAETREKHDRGLPDYVEKELREYLKCGILAHGFGRAECRHCHRQIVVAFSCKRRGACPSCSARRMCNTAAFLTDRVLPDRPIRQWVLSVPFNIRFLLASRADAFTALTRIFIEETLHWYRRSAAELGVAHGRGGAISVQHRFGGALNLNCHVHAAVIDGVFTRDDPSARANFRPIPAPDTYALEFIIERVYRRLIAWLRRRDLLAEYGYELDRGEPSALEACVRASLSQTGLARLDEREFVETTDRDGRVNTALAAPRRAKGKHGFEALGFNLHAGVRIEADDRVGRERLLRYCMRAPLSLERLSVLRDGRIAYKLQRPWRGGETHRVMQPIEVLARLSALVPPPRHPLIRFHGVLAPHSSWRRSVIRETPRDEHEAAVCVDASASDAPPEESASTAPSTGIDPARTRREPVVPGAPTEAVLDPARLLRLGKPAPFEPGKARYSSGIWRIDWATLLKRVYSLDALACPCGGRLKFVEVVTEAERARGLLEQLGLRAAPPPVARARSPTVDPDSAPEDW